jgi:hypothetical protein
MTENDIARVIFANLFPLGMCPADWDSGAILGPDNCVREQFLAAARALLSASIADTAGAFNVALRALDDYQANWDTGLPSEYAQSERIAMECAVEAVRDALNDAAAGASQERADADTADYKRMFEEAVSALAAIDKALGIDPDEAGGAAPILEAIERLRDDGKCKSCIDNKCVTGPECVTLGRDAAPTPERADADTAGANQVLTAHIINGEVIDVEYTGNLMDGEYALYTARPSLTEGQQATLLACAFKFEAEGNKPMAEDVRSLLAATPAPSVADAAGAIDKKAIAWDAHITCSRIPGATHYNAAEIAIDAVLNAIAKESGND